MTQQISAICNEADQLVSDPEVIVFVYLQCFRFVGEDSTVDQCPAAIHAGSCDIRLPVKITQQSE